MKTHKVKRIVNDWLLAASEAEHAGLQLRIGDDNNNPFEVLENDRWLFRCDCLQEAAAFCSGYRAREEFTS